MNIVEVKGVSKRFKNSDVLSDVNQVFESGKIYGLCGENGCGKTVLIRLISGLAKPTEGIINYNGINIEKHKQMQIGIVINGSGFFDDMSAFDNLKLLASIRNKITDDDIKRAIYEVGLDPDNKKSVGKYSLGMKQRLCIAQAIMENVEILLLDEPTNALDENGVKLIHKIIRSEKEKGKIIILTSHNKFDIDSLCDVICRIQQGRVFVDEG